MRWSCNTFALCSPVCSEVELSIRFAFAPVYAEECQAYAKHSPPVQWAQDRAERRTCEGVAVQSFAGDQALTKLAPTCPRRSDQAIAKPLRCIYLGGDQAHASRATRTMRCRGAGLNA